jgi:hypothetical protein
MALINIPFRPGFNKQVTKASADYSWVDGDFVRFRYGLPEKIGGWIDNIGKTLPGVAREIHIWTDVNSNRYIALGTNKGLFVYYDGAFYDISPLETIETSATFTSTNGSATVTVNKTSHTVVEGDLIIFSSVTMPGSGTSLTATDFTTNTFEVVEVVNANQFQVTMAVNETGSGLSAAGSGSFSAYVSAGGTTEFVGYGWGASTWNDTTWGTARSATSFTLEPGAWSLDNYGAILIGTVKNGKTFEWDPNDGLTTRATVSTGNPTASVMTIVSDRDRHLIHLGTETTIGTASSQNKMFIRFSDQEDRTTYVPTSTNTAGTFQLDSGTRIVGAVKSKDYILVLTDNAAYTMQFVGPPFTFSIRQVGANCGAIGKFSMVHVDGVVYWMAKAGGFFVFDGTVKKIPCSVEDFVFTNVDTGDLGINYGSGDIVYAGYNSLFTEINWFYPKAGQTQIDRCVTYNYREDCWTTSSLARTTYYDKTVYDNPYATEFSETATPSFPTINGATASGASTLYAHENDVDQINVTGTRTTIPAFIESGDFNLGGKQDDNETFLSMKRFIPDFKVLQGNAQVTMQLKDFPSDSDKNSLLSPFTIDSSTKKVDTRVRSRFASVKIENISTEQNWRFDSFRADVRPDGRR